MMLPNPSHKHTVSSFAMKAVEVEGVRVTDVNSEVREGVSLQIETEI